MSRWAILLLVACEPKAPPPAEPAAAPLFAITEQRCGPLTATSPATLVGLRTAFAGYDVAPVNSETLEYRVTRGGERILDVIPDEAGAILNVHVMSPDVELAGHAWRVGAPFTLEHVSTCECWGEQIVCFQDGAHVAVALARVCREGTLATFAARKALAGVPIRAAIWSVHPLAPGGYATPEAVDRTR